MLLNSVATTRPGTGLVLAEAVDFDGANDYLSRSSDLTGNADGKTFTFSAWVYRSSDSLYTAGLIGNTAGVNNSYIQISDGTVGDLRILLYGASAYVVSATVTAVAVPLNTWYHILISVDLANTANRYIYINDISQSVTWTTYTDANIDWTRNTWAVGSRSGGSNKLTGRLAHVFLDYTYRDLSNSTNRRLFITSDRKPVNKSILTALNPILYLPMDDPSTAHVNAGTGGNFTLNGTIARSGRGPNQFNVPYSDLDGAADYLSKTTSIGAIDGSAFTLALCINQDILAGPNVFTIKDSSTVRFQLWFGGDGTFNLLGYTSAAGILLNASSAAGAMVAGRNYAMVISLDLANSSNRHVYVNGSSVSMTWTTYTNGSIDFNPSIPRYYVSDTTGYHDGKIGNVFFHTSYIDLSVPANLAKFVTGTGIDAKPVDMGANGELPLGVQPLIYLPMYGNNAGKNYGTGGDFTVNSGPYPGARGPNEFWGNKADFASPGYLARTSAITGLSTSKTFSASFHLNVNSTAANNMVFATRTEGGAGGIGMYVNISGALLLIGYNAATSTILQITAGSLSASTQYAIHVCIDLADTGKRYVYVNGVSQALTITTYTNDSIDLSGVRGTVGAGWNGSAYASNLQGKLSEFYFTTDYIDFSQESNRLKFRDAFGNPVDLTPQIQAGTLPNPAIYMRFDPADQGKNSGTGGNFTKTGTIADGGQL